MRVLLIEDQIATGEALKKEFGHREIVVESVPTFEEASYLAKEFEYAAVIFDLFAPETNAEGFLKELRTNPSGLPVMITTHRKSLQDKKHAFELGADDYLVKPYEIEELYLRIRALARRKHGFYGSMIQVQNLIVDLNAKTCMVNKTPLILTAKEYSLLEFLLLRQNHIISRERITRELYQDEKEQVSNVIDVLISKVRKKLEDLGASALIETIRGEGYVIRNS